MDVGVVVITRNRRSELLTNLPRLRATRAAHVVVVDNGSDDGTAGAVRDAFPWAEVLALRRNAGPYGRTLGVRRLRTQCVAFADDDSWWSPDAFANATRAFAAHPRLGLIAARIVVEPEGITDPTCALMAASPLPPVPGTPWPSVLGFLACGAIVRRDAFLAAGGFHRTASVGGEEELLALDLASGGWDLAYLDQVTAHHRPSHARDQSARRIALQRNAALTAWLRLPLEVAVRRTLSRPHAPRTVVAMTRLAPALARDRHRIDDELLQRVALLQPDVQRTRRISLPSARRSASARSASAARSSG